MPLKEMSPEAIVREAAKMDSDLASQLRRCQVSEHVIALLAEANFTTLFFQFFGNDAADVEKKMELLGIKSSEGLRDHREISAMKAAWQAVSIFQVADDKQRSESKLLGMVAPMKTSEYTSARIAYERAHGKMHEIRMPAQSIIDALEADMEEGTFKAPRLKELPSKEEVDKANEGRTDASGFSMT